MALTYKEEKNIGYIYFDNDDSKVNLLSSEVLKQFDKVLDDIKGRTYLQAVIIASKKKDVFIAGADIQEIQKIVEPKDGAAKAKAGQDVLNKLEDLPMPTIAVIDGVALGGGCELALACHYRVATFNDRIRIGLPETQLGFVPGFGGTYRLPRIIGLPESLGMILAGKRIDSTRALRIGLVDKLFPQVGLQMSIEKYVADIVSKKISKRRFLKPKIKSLTDWLMNSSIGHKVIFSKAREGVLRETKGRYPAPLKAIDVITRTLYRSRRDSLPIEAQAFGELAVTDISKNLVHVFYLSEEYRKLSIEGADQIKPNDIKSCAILGAGVMGGGIAQALAAKDIWARMKDINYDAVAKGFQAAGKIFYQAVSKRRMKKHEAEGKMAHISGTTDYHGFKFVDMVIEAVVENMDVKKKVFKELSDVTGPQTILATNTSALSVTEMGKQTKDPSKVIGIHFFNPVHRMPLIEVITTPSTSKETIVATLNLVKRLGKTPILVKDSCGFVVNRILLAYINEAGRILEETGDMTGIDKTMTDFGMPMGPFTLSDEVGLDVGIKVLHILENAFGERFKAGPVFEKVFEKKWYGKKTNKGFYLHEKERVPNPDINGLLPGGRKGLDRDECTKRLIYIMLNEAAGCLQDGIVDKAGAIDIGMIFGTGFPPFRGGLLKYADDLGIDKVVGELEQLQKKLNAERFKPNPYLLKLNENKKRFF
jgi:3-hydroxyacyl-CoA dehydrogenase / enoyl-CoA hydratase / 3-hydroxybutyryl-CoA epimerase